MHPACSRATRLAVVATVGCVLVACSIPTTGEAVRPTSPNSRESNSSVSPLPTVSSTLPGPHPPPNEYTNGTTFEPCTAFGADELRNWGVDPTNVEDVGVGNPLLRGCRWRPTNRSWSLGIRVHNSAVEKYLQPDNTLKLQEPITIGGRSSAVNSPDGRQTSCDVIVPSEKAVVIFTVNVYSGDEGPKLVPDACNKAIDVATAVAGRLPQ
ncbi:DUF3558 domain-containing protein [Mycobacterium sp. NPDC050853]|uniref:DUF3558 domain-containing protein n=1 Tax=Mycobacterium sp. NPDC050853 TaxID=3155160 RepID=UPI0033D21335